MQGIVDWIRGWEDEGLIDLECGFTEECLRLGLINYGFALALRVLGLVLTFRVSE